jgi:hypothetical protein
MLGIFYPKAINSKQAEISAFVLRYFSIYLFDYQWQAPLGAAMYPSGSKSKAS